MKRHTIAALSLVLLCSGTLLQASTKSKPKLARAEAEKIALAKEPGTIKSGELEREHHKLIYSFDVKTAKGLHEVNVDAMTGEVVEDSVESAKDEAAEAKQDAAKPKN